MSTTIKAYRTHPVIYAIITIIVYILLGTYGSLALFTSVLINYLLKYRADKELMSKETKNEWLLRAVTNLSLIAVITILLSFTF